MSVWEIVKGIGKSLYDYCLTMQEEVDRASEEVARRNYTDDELLEQYNRVHSGPRRVAIKRELESRGYSFDD